MIRKSSPSGHDPMGGHRFSEKDQAQTRSRSAMTIQPEFIAFWSMIRKSGYRFSTATNAERVCAEIMLKSKR
jgi:hypothetical protein